MSVEFSSYGVALLIIQGLVILALFRALRSSLERTDLRDITRARIDRLLPVGEAITALVYFLSAIPQVLKDDPEWSPIAVALVLIGVGYVSWFAIRDYVNGVFLRAGRVIRVGDQIAAAGQHGIVQRLGIRTLTLLTNDDQEVVVPYSSVSQKPISRRAIGPNVYRHEVHLPRPTNLSDNAIEKLQLAAALMHWSAVSQPCKIELRTEYIVVVLHLVSSEYVAKAESHLHQTLKQLETQAEDATTNALPNAH